jgi:hypothetical protein
MVGVALVKSLYALSTWTRTVALVRAHAALRLTLGCPTADDGPSKWACYRFAAKLRRFKPLLVACLNRLTASLHAAPPGLAPILP